MDVPVPFKPVTKHRYLSSVEVRRRSERATASAVGSLLASTEYEQWTERKSKRRTATWAAASLLLGLLVGWLTADGWSLTDSTTTGSDLSHVYDTLRTASAPEGDITAAVDHIRVLEQEAATLRSGSTALTDTIQELSNRLEAADFSSAELMRTGQQQQRVLHEYNASISTMQRVYDLTLEELNNCRDDVARAAWDLEAAMQKQGGAVQAAKEQEKVVAAAVSAQSECAAHLKLSQGEVRNCAADLTLSRQRSVEASSAAATCEMKLKKAYRELEYALTDSEALIARSKASRIHTAFSIAAGLALAVLLIAAYSYTYKRKITSLQLEREKLLLDKLEAEAGCGSMRGRSVRVESRRLHD